MPRPPTQTTHTTTRFPPPPSSLPGILEYLHELKGLHTNITKYPLEKLAIEFNKSALDDYKAGQGGGVRMGDWAAAVWVGDQATRPPGPPIPHPLSPLPQTKISLKGLSKGKKNLTADVLGVRGTGVGVGGGGPKHRRTDRAAHPRGRTPAHTRTHLNHPQLKALLTPEKELHQGEFSHEAFEGIKSACLLGVGVVGRAQGRAPAPSLLTPPTRLFCPPAEHGQRAYVFDPQHPGNPGKHD